MQQINSVNADGNTPLMVLLLPPASVEPVAVPTADTTIDASLAEKSFDQDQLSKAQFLPVTNPQKLIGEFKFEKNYENLMSIFQIFHLVRSQDKPS